MRLEIALGGLGAAVALVYGFEHNSRVYGSFGGGFVFEGGGFLLLAAAGFGLGFMLGLALRGRR